MHHLESLIRSIPFNLFNPSNPTFIPPLPSSSTDPSSPHASLASAQHAFPLGVPPPSLSIFPLMGPSAHFPSTNSPINGLNTGTDIAMNKLSEDTARMSLSPSYLYLDDEGYTRWQGETSGLPLLDMLVERELPGSSSKAFSNKDGPLTQPKESWSRKSEHVTTGDWFPDRQPRATTVNPEVLWKLITSLIVPELMDR